MWKSCGGKPQKWNRGERSGKDALVGDGAAVDGWAVGCRRVSPWLAGAWVGGWAEKFGGLVGCYAEWLVGWVGRRVQMVGVWVRDRAEKLDEWVGNFAASTRSGSQGAPP